MKTVCVFFALLCAVVGSATMVMGSTTEIELLESRLVDDPTNISLLMQLGELYHSLAMVLLKIKERIISASWR